MYASFTSTVRKILKVEYVIKGKFCRLPAVLKSGTLSICLDIKLMYQTVVNLLSVDTKPLDIFSRSVRLPTPPEATRHLQTRLPKHQRSQPRRTRAEEFLSSLFRR